MNEMQDQFLSEEDLDLRNLTWEELVAYWNLWLLQAQSSNDLDEAHYSHGVFESDPAVGRRRERDPIGDSP
jgi:hypothetical protein